MADAFDARVAPAVAAARCQGSDGKRRGPYQVEPEEIRKHTYEWVGRK